MADTIQRDIRHKLKQEYMSEAVDDYHRGIFFIRKTALDQMSDVICYVIK